MYTFAPGGFIMKTCVSYANYIWEGDEILWRFTNIRMFTSRFRSGASR